MSDSNKKKQEFYLSVNATAEKLRALADELEGGAVSVSGEKCSIAPDTEVKISLKAKDHTFSAKLKFKLANHLSEVEEEEEGVPAPSTESGLEDYKDLKLRMAKDFKAIKKSCIQEQSLPNSDLVEQFYRDSKTMCTYPNKGEDFYEGFLKEAGLFYEAFKMSDLAAMGAAVIALGQLRSDCHGKHK